MNAIKKNLLLIIWIVGGIFFLLTFLYGYIVFNKISEGYKIPYYGVIFFISCLPLVVLYGFSRQYLNMKIVISMLFIYFLFSLSGPLIPIFIVPLISLFYII